MWRKDLCGARFGMRVEMQVSTRTSAT